jgi:catechol 2,3-dioxygenase-like lactoylglutathione lyase family enzyme
VPAKKDVSEAPVRALFRTLGLALLILGRANGLGADPAETPPPVGVAGIAGVTYLTTDFAPLRRFYGEGAGFTEVPCGPGRIRFAVGTSQWIEFQEARAPSWPRRLQYVTLEAADLVSVESELRARNVPAPKIGSAPESDVEIEDPAGNRIRVTESHAAPVAASFPSGFSRHLQHFGFAVERSRAEATRAFYRDTLGWPEAVRMAGPDGRLAMVKFSLPGWRHEFVELIFFDPPLNKWAAGAFDHMNFEVTNIDDTYRTLHRGGIATESRHFPKVNGERFWSIDIMDPELTRMEILVLTPAKEEIGTISKPAGG